MEKNKPFDFGIFLTVLVLLSIGIIMVFSASQHYALTFMGSSYFFLSRQLVWAIIGFFAMLFFANFDYKRWAKLSGILLIISIIMLVVILIPGVSDDIRGSGRWIKLGPLGQFQPSEFAKLSLIIFLSTSLSKRSEELKKFKTGLLPYLVIIGIIDGLLLLEPHMSASGVITLIAFILIFVAGGRIAHFAWMTAPIAGLTALMVMIAPYRFARVTSHFNPWADPLGKGFQAIQSLYAIGSGGIFGLGLGRSRQKFLYLPDAHNDFIFSILGEELGFIGVTIVLLLFLILIWRGLKVAMSSPDMFGSLLATGITLLIAVQVIINISVVTGVVPVTGMPLPFFSYGGTSLLMIMSCIGILLNISRYSNSNRS